MQTRFRAIACFLLCLPVLILLGRPTARPKPSAPPQAPKPAPAPSLTLLDDVGRLARNVAEAEVAGWRTALHNGHLAKEEAAKRQLWLGEWELAKNEAPQQAEWHLHQARLLSASGSKVRGLATYDSAIVLFYSGAYAKCGDAFQHVMVAKPALKGFNRKSCVLWQRHARACAGYHAQRAKLGIVEPERLDPLCGVAALAACLRQRSLPFDKPTLLAHSHVTGEGNNLQDIANAAKALGASVYPVNADEEGLKALPKPLVAYVEHDHFIAVTGANRSGVTYLCSDCGAWPGGRQHLSWKQWRAMEAGPYLAVALPNSTLDHALQELLMPAENTLHTASAISRRCPAGTAPLMALLRSHVSLFSLAITQLQCGQKLGSPNCPCPVKCATDCDPVNLSTGEEEYHSEPDLTVYNPIGPSVSWHRLYNSLRNSPQTSIDFDGDFGVGWSHSYNVSLELIGYNGTSFRLTEENGSTIDFRYAAAPQANATAPVTCLAVNSGVPMVLQWYWAGTAYGSPIYNVDIVFSNRSRWRFSQPQQGGVLYPLTQVYNSTNQYINLIQATQFNAYGNYSFSLQQITDSNNQPLLTITRADAQDPFSLITRVDDRYNRRVYYKNTVYPKGWNVGDYSGLSWVSQVVSSSVPITSAPYRYQYGYTPVYSGDAYDPSEQYECLNQITEPSLNASGSPRVRTFHYHGESTADYQGDHLMMISSQVDPNGIQHCYTYNDDSTTTVTVKTAAGATVYTRTASFNQDMSISGMKEGTNTQQTFAYNFGGSGDQIPTNRPTTVTDGTGKNTTYTWDQYGNMTSVTTPRGITTNVQLFRTIPSTIRWDDWNLCR